MKLVFRFDIDTHKCIRDGVPNLLKLSEKTGVPFSFYLNLGRSISFFESMKEILSPSITHTNSMSAEKIEMMSAREKLGNMDYLIAAIINPKISNYKKVIKALCCSSCEIGIHGGKNHALWHKYATKWDKQKIEEEVAWALNTFNKIVPGYKPRGFASPGWSSPAELASVLKQYGFEYVADLRVNGQKGDCLIENDGIIPKIGVNLLGEPGGVAFFENRRVLGWSTQQIVDYVIEEVKKNTTCVLYDHPYYAGIRELETIESIIVRAKKEDIKIVRTFELLRNGE